MDCWHMWTNQNATNLNTLIRDLKSIAGETFAYIFFTSTNKFSWRTMVRHEDYV